MPKMCEVPGCKEIGAHQFPRDASVAKMWLKAIRRKKFKPKKDSRICRNHFLETDYQKISIHTGTENQHRYLKKTAVPSVFIWTTSLRSQEAQARDQRLLNRNIKKKLFTPFTEKETSRSEDVSITENINVSNQDDHTIPDIPYEQYIESEVTIELEETTELEETIPIQNRCFGTQTSTVLRIFSTDFLQTDDESVMFYTGLESYSKLQLMLNTLLPMANNLTYRWSRVVGLSVEDQFLILLIKLRRNKPDFELSKMFNVSKTEVSNVIVTWLHFVYNMWSMIDIWPRRDLVDYYMPVI